MISELVIFKNRCALLLTDEGGNVFDFTLKSLRSGFNVSTDDIPEAVRSLDYSAESRGVGVDGAS